MLNQRRFNKGDRIPLSLQCVDANDAPVWPDAGVVATIYDSSENADKTIYLSPLDKFRHTGLFVGNFLNDLDAGHYIVIIAWAEDSNARNTPDSFEVLNAGDTEGAITEVYDHLGPGPANGIVHQTATGKIYFGRNPR